MTNCEWLVTNKYEYVLMENRILSFGQDTNLKDRTKKYALQVIKLVESLPQTCAADIIGKQLIRCATSVGANYRAACRARSSADFIAKMKIVEEEADESLYWMELLIESGIPGSATVNQIKEVLKEGNQSVAITVASIKTVRQRQSIRQSNPNSSLLNRHSSFL